MLADLLKNLYSTLSNQFPEGTTSRDLEAGGDKISDEVWKEIVAKTAITTTTNHNKVEEINNNNKNNKVEEMTL